MSSETEIEAKSIKTDILEEEADEKETNDTKDVTDTDEESPDNDVHDSNTLVTDTENDTNDLNNTKFVTTACGDYYNLAIDSTGKIFRHLTLTKTCIRM